MLVLERTHFGPAHQDRTKCVALSNQRHAKDGAMAPFERELPSQWELSPCALQINYMYGLLVTNGPPHNSCAVKRHRFPASQDAANFADGGPDAHHAVFDDNNVNELRLADAGSVLGNRLENRHYVARRVRDHAQDIADRGLLLQRFSQFVKQACVLDGDDGLGSEGLQQGDLPLAEEASLGTAERDHADRDTFSHQGDAEDRAVALTPRVLAGVGKLVALGLYISDVDGPPVQHRSTTDRAADEWEEGLGTGLRDRAVMGDKK